MKILFVSLFAVSFLSSISYASCSMSTKTVANCSLDNGDTIEITNRPECGYDKYLVKGTDELTFNGVVDNDKSQISTYRFGSLRVLISYEAQQILATAYNALGDKAKNITRTATVVRVIKGTKKLESVGIAICHAVEN